MLLAVAAATFGVIGYATFAGNNTQSKADAIIASAKSKINTEFYYGAEGESSFDSSGFIYWSFEKQNGVKLATERGSLEDYFSTGKEVSKADLKKGDIVFFGSNDEPTSAGIYVDSDNFVIASGSYGKVTVLNFNSHLANPTTKKEDKTRKTYSEIFLGAKRVLGTNFPETEVTNLKSGDKNTDVESLQQVLNTIGYRVEKSGNFDDQTEAAIKSLQNDYKLPQTGVYDARTKEVVNELKNFRINKLLYP